ncbi:Cache domain family protein, partial [bacterium]|nr:Cache domain family protein [bacterium]
MSLAAGVAFLAAPAIASADEFGSADEAKALVGRVVEHIAKAGVQVAFKDFSETKGAFVDRDLYVFCIAANGDVVAHGGNPA